MQLHGFSLVTPPATDLVVTLAETKLALRVDGTDLDAELTRLIRSATRQAETEMRRALLTQTWQLTLDGFPACGAIQLPFGCTSVTSVQYVDEAGATQTLAGTSYHVDVTRAPGRLVRADSVTWPTIDVRPNAVTVTIVCGFGAVADVPAEVKDWILAHVGARLRNPEAYIVGTSATPMPGRFIDALLDGWRLITV
jgi:uncharacterized phiE125 gp8 family phage protein